MPASILIADDYEDNRELLRLMLEAVGYRVREASNGRECISMAQAEMPDILLVDLSMPVLDGWGVLRELRADERTTHLPCVAVTAFADPTRELMCLTKDRIGLTEADTRVKVAFVGTNTVGNSLLVCAQYPMSSVTGIFSPLLSGKVMTSKVEMRIEKVDLALTAGEETTLAGENWTWCA